ncbi:peptidoglycan DD-metalloendopeptidase family protein [Oxynema sp. CENA135]|uniref:peptidoglycan DD-metalloendopeptidase family protein n=1 Tax=Oxynema sp. CENA135 TaxID=984206 RepID=UPI0019094119|nr:peptidoglycan DD-metalloendopeptidase family protein [Oxynema sp. CENA135]MBK4730253.1 peptidoglycan DD-metalloendopeptidase family protein [Oxynema sp. CENA135]
MIVHKVAIGTLAALATAELTQEVNVSANTHTPLQPTCDWVAGTPSKVNSGEGESPQEAPTAMTGCLSSEAPDIDTDRDRHSPVPECGDKSRSHDGCEPIATDSEALGESDSPETIGGEFGDRLARRSQLTDLGAHWAKPFIEALQADGVIQGFPDGSFRPNAPMTRAQFAAVVERAFRDPPTQSRPDRRPRSARTQHGSDRVFRDVSERSWAQNAIEAAADMGFLTGFPNQEFAPDRPIARLQVLVALVRGLNLTPTDAASELSAAIDTTTIPDYAQTSWAASRRLTEQLQQRARQMGISIPEDWLNQPNGNATRAEVAALIYEALAISTQPEATVNPISTPNPSVSAGADRANQQRPTEIKPNTPDPRSIRKITEPIPWVEPGVNLSWNGAPSASVPVASPQENPPESDGEANAETAKAIAYRQDRSDAIAPESVTAWGAKGTRDPEPRSYQPEADVVATRTISRLQILQERIGATRIPDMPLPPLAAAGTYLPDPTPIFDGYIWPARGILTSGYGWRWGRMHKGIDIAGPLGTPILAASAGVVTYAAWNAGGYGNLVEIQHPDGSFTRYAHNYRILVREGQSVEQGQLIAQMGTTGNSTGVHLHFEIHPPGEDAVDPLAYLPGDRRQFQIDAVVGQAQP